MKHVCRYLLLLVRLYSRAGFLSVVQWLVPLSTGSASQIVKDLMDLGARVDVRSSLGRFHASACPLFLSAYCDRGA